MTRVRFTGSWACAALVALLAVACEGKTSSPGQVAAPTFSPSAGTFASAQDVTLASATTGATIRYTTDGSNPTASTGTVYTGAIHVTATATIKAIATSAGMSDSEVVSATFTILPSVAAPTFSPAAGSFASAQDVTLASATTGATIRYTLDGSNPTASTGTVYASPIHVATTTTIKAIAVKTDMSDSAVSSATFTIRDTVAAPTFSPTAGTFNAPQDVALASATTGASIRYTTDGSDPTASTGTVYASPVHVAATTTIKAIAYKTDMNDSAVSSAAYTILETVATPSFSPAAGSFSTVQDVTLTSATAGAVIRYTIDGTDPSPTNGTTFSAPIHLAATTTIKAYATKAGMVDSAVATAIYTIDLTKAASPGFTPAPGAYNVAQSVALASNTPNAAIHYTMTSDGSEPAVPTAASPLYGTAIALDLPASGTTTYRIKAIASAAGFSDSTVADATYTLQPQAAAPTFTPAAGTYQANHNVAIASATPGATVYYTMKSDGSDPADPTTSSPQATAPIFVAAPETGTTTYKFKAFATAAGHADSTISSGTFTLQPNPNGYELLTAGDFESNPGGDIWGFNKPGTVTTSIEDCTADGFTGRCQKITGGAYGTNAYDTQLAQQAGGAVKYFSIKANKKYTFTMKARASAARSVQVLMQTSDHSSQVLQTFNLTTSVATYTWEFYGTGQQLAFKINLGGAANDNTTFELDDLSVLETDAYGDALQVTGTSTDNTYGSIGVGLKFDLTGQPVDTSGGTYTVSFDLYAPSATPPNKLQFHFQNSAYATVGVDIPVNTIPLDAWTRLTFPVTNPPLWANPLANASMFNIFYGAPVGTSETFYLRNVKVTNGTNTPVNWSMAAGTDPSSLYAWVGASVVKTIVQK